MPITSTRPHIAQVLLIAVCATSLVFGFSSARGDNAKRAQQSAAARPAQVQDFQRRLGPFDLNGQRFSIVLDEKRLSGAPGSETQETVARMEIRDATGQVHYQDSFDDHISEEGFDETTAVNAAVLQGSRDEKGLLLTYGVLPSPPLGGESWQVFGTFDGKLVPFSKPIFADGQLVGVGARDGVIRTVREPNFLPDVIEFRIWAQNFFVIVPLRVDWMMAKMRPAWRCAKMTSRGWMPICSLKVEADRVAQKDELTFVRLLPESFEPEAVAEHIILKRDSRVKILGVDAAVLWEEEPHAVQLGIGNDPWLKVSIDGKQGWIHTQEEFIAIGLPPAG